MCCRIDRPVIVFRVLEAFSPTMDIGWWTVLENRLSAKVSVSAVDRSLSFLVPVLGFPWSTLDSRWSSRRDRDLTDRSWSPRPSTADRIHPERNQSLHSLSWGLADLFRCHPSKHYRHVSRFPLLSRQLVEPVDDSSVSVSDVRLRDVRSANERRAFSSGSEKCRRRTSFCKTWMTAWLASVRNNRADLSSSADMGFRSGLPSSVRNSSFSSVTSWASNSFFEAYWARSSNCRSFNLLCSFNWRISCTASRSS